MHSTIYSTNTPYYSTNTLTIIIQPTRPISQPPPLGDLAMALLEFLEENNFEDSRAPKCRNIDTTKDHRYDEDDDRYDDALFFLHWPRNLLSTHPINISYQHILNPPFQLTLSTSSQATLPNPSIISSHLITHLLSTPHPRVINISIRVRVRVRGRELHAASIGGSRREGRR